MSSGGQIKTAQSNALSSRLESSQRKPTCILTKTLYQRKKRKSSTIFEPGTAEFCDKSEPGCRELILGNSRMLKRNFNIRRGMVPLVALIF
jgi:hypothetical protein